MEEETKVLVVDDNDVASDVIAKFVRRHGHTAVVCKNVEEAFRAFDADHFHVVLTDVKMGVLGGFDLLRGIRKRAPNVPVVLITGQASVSDAMDAMDAGAFDYLSKPVEYLPLGQLLRRAIEHHRMMLRAEIEDAPNEPLPPPLPNIIGSSRVMLAAFKRVAKAARGDANVLILGENGTGKEMVARALHDNSDRADKPFVAVNVPAIAAGVAESELFGHRRGAFTDARESRTGLFEQAHGGTLFLDEIGDLDLGLQVKLLRAIQERTIKPVGGNEEIEVDIRLVSATNQNLLQRVKDGRFREDLYYRINVVQISLPPLRERVEDIPQLASYFLARYGSKPGRRIPRLSEEALLALQHYRWPGNVRELENVMQRSVQFCTDGLVTPDLLMLGEDELLAARTRQDMDDAGAAPPQAVGAHGFLPLRDKMELYMDEVIEATGGNLTQAAKILGVARRTLQRLSAKRKRTA
ncbi:MAG: sigma-54-dependent Fis family transcriptional regulator [Candidatus Eisenbacteria bacterium]|nr:sigma-54-dependent Fis family transcriptional regulator [Candidatus Eisenbacteria bacterium]